MWQEARLKRHCAHREGTLRGAARLLCADALRKPRPSARNRTQGVCDCRARKLDFAENRKNCGRSRNDHTACWQQCCRSFAPQPDTRG